MRWKALGGQGSREAGISQTLKLDDSCLNNVGAMNSEQPREEANSAEGAPPNLNQQGARASVRGPAFRIGKKLRQSIILF